MQYLEFLIDDESKLSGENSLLDYLEWENEITFLVESEVENKICIEISRCFTNHITGHLVAKRLKQ